MTTHRCDEVEERLEAMMETMLEKAAEAGAARALKNVGLNGDGAADDVRDLRGLLDSFRAARRAAWLTAVGVITTGFLIVLLIGSALKIRSLGGSQ